MTKILAVLLLVLPLSGCWFVFIPGSMISAVGDSLSGAKGNGCIDEVSQLGSRIRMPNGEIGTVRHIDGPSVRCSGRTPIRALVQAD